MKHTPGPWKVEAGRLKTPIGSEHKHIALVNHYQSTSRESVVGDEHDANARLIAKAPEMYEFLMRFQQITFGQKLLENWRAEAVELLAEIEGES